MNFGSSFVYVYENPEYEVISDEELEDGMHLSDSDEDVDLLNTIPEASLTATQQNALKKRGSEQTAGTGADENVADAMLGEPPAPPTGPSSSTRPRPPPPPALTAKQKKGHWRRSKGDIYEPLTLEGIKGRRERRADTNVISINFSNLVTPGHMFTGDPVYCADCKSLLSNISKINKDEDQQVWRCEFCYKENTIDIMEEEIPKEEDVTFMLEPALSTSSAGPSGTDESLVIFCVDVSGSMCVTTEVPGHINFRGSHALSRIQRTREDQRDQYLPRQRRDVTYVSRLQAAQAAVDHQLEEMHKEHPNRRVALIAFNNEVTVIGDGKETPVTVAGNKLTDKEELVKIGQDLKMPIAVKESRKQLGEQVFSLEEGGATALGPALLIATTMAAQHPGSKVIICTDGMANVGLGRLDLETEEEDEGEFYEQVGIEASSKGVTISVISIKGTHCKLVHLGQLADKTGGQVNMVDPLKLTQEFSTILADRIIATNVVATLLLHKNLYVEEDGNELSRVERKIGNVTADTEITFEYGIRTGNKQEEAPVPMETDQASGDMKPPEAAGTSKEGGQKFKVDVPDELPFQLQIKYTDTEGATALRVLTKTKPVTRDRREAELKTNVKVIGTHVQKSTAAMALDGMYTGSRSKALMNQRLMWRHKKSVPMGTTDRDEAETAYRGVFDSVSKLEKKVNLAQKKERSTFGRTRSDSEGSDDEDQSVPSASFSAPAKPSAATKAKMFLKKKKAMRSRELSDSFSVECYQNLQKPQFSKGKKSRDSDSD